METTDRDRDSWRGYFTAALTGHLPGDYDLETNVKSIVERAAAVADAALAYEKARRNPAPVMR